MTKSIHGLFGFVLHETSQSWGKSIHVMERHGWGYGRLYTYNDQPSIAYMEGLSVCDWFRGHGLGRALQELRERISVEQGATEMQLWVQEDSWMHEWYLRRGYMDAGAHDTEPGCIWMKKSLT